MSVKFLSWLLSVGLALAVGLVGKLAWTNYQLNQRTSQLNEQLMQANLELGRAHTQFGNVEKYVKTLEEGIQAEIKERNAIATSFAHFKANLKINKPVTIVKNQVKTIYKDKIIEVPAKLELKLGGVYQVVGPGKVYEISVIPFKFKDHLVEVYHMAIPNLGNFGFKHKFGYRISLGIAGQMVETRTSSGAVNHYLNLYALGPNGEKTQRLNLQEFNVVVKDLTKPKWWWWSPHIDIGALGLVDQNLKLHAGGSLGFSVGGYGHTKNDLSWRYLRLSLDLSKKAGIGISPVVYNMGEFLPLISDLWIGPHLTWALKDEWLMGFTLNSIL